MPPHIGLNGAIHFVGPGAEDESLGHDADKKIISHGADVHGIQPRISRIRPDKGKFGKIGRGMLGRGMGKGQCSKLFLCQTFLCHLRPFFLPSSSLVAASAALCPPRFISGRDLFGVIFG